MSHTVLQAKGYRFVIFERDFQGRPVHVYRNRAEAMFFTDPEIAVSKQTGFEAKDIREIERVLSSRKDEVQSAWEELLAEKKKAKKTEAAKKKALATKMAESSKEETKPSRKPLIRYEPVSGRRLISGLRRKIRYALIKRKRRRSEKKRG
ncbi:MAG: DUF4160 domain-containing protein [Opitutales bacterium]|nr:DUF4160 domain-containing protein [Opitutales bacterium]MCH8540985.1 DUF4160 domain-containing protein [Opitutales bacterium]